MSEVRRSGRRREHGTAGLRGLGIGFFLGFLVGMASFGISVATRDERIEWTCSGLLYFAASLAWLWGGLGAVVGMVTQMLAESFSLRNRRLGKRFAELARRAEDLEDGAWHPVTCVPPAEAEGIQPGLSD